MSIRGRRTRRKIREFKRRYGTTTMAQDLKLAKDIIKPDGPKIGQFWRDMVTGDVLKIIGLSLEPIQELPWKINADNTYENCIPYVRCACYPRGEYYMGIQEMKASHFETERFQRVGWFKTLWYRVKLRKAQLLA